MDDVQFVRNSNRLPLNKPHPGEFIRERRKALGLKPEEVASKVGLNVSSYYDLEQVETELQSVISLAEIARLESVLLFDIRSTLSTWTESSVLEFTTGATNTGHREYVLRI